MTLLINRCIGIAAMGSFTVVVSLIGWNIIKATLGLRVDPETEQRGLDTTEMGMTAYPENVLKEF